MIILDGPKLFDRVSKVGFESWKHDMHGMITDYLFVNCTHGWPCGEKEIVFRTCIIKSLVKYERMVVASLLELMAWKLNCLHLNGSGKFQTMQGILDQSAIDESFDPVEYKHQCRFSSNVGVIMERLLEFLW
ncbi:unnamed protein product [Cylindrotheca closterium]|uniref:Uncharacterized protein n=1 Tax=Cylindrotheca closterium TaxID=2856 RepID=A0AAD2FWF3_9STRA|nr:unnamed protein product [Cylindrotheca closterium]